ncbi:MAG TPA: hypothetical protein VE526_14630 [Solirubrobacteraceae bacterium]|nr:hypothetical protein [Solirubrobacteraceae bacterium]
MDSDRPRLLRRGGTVAAVLSRDAARVTLRRDRGRDIVVATTAGADYTGRWAGDVRFFAAAVGRARDVTRAIVRDAAGAIIGIGERGAPRPRIRRRVLAERDGLGVHLVRRGSSPACVGACLDERPER